MSVFKRFFPNFFSGFWIVMLIALWIAFAPQQAGGMAAYIIVIGNSMEPNFHIGDLVIVHDEADYRVGDAIVYKNLELGSFVFHRIIEEEMGRYTLKGDNNSWTDTFQPSREDVLGKLWLYIPKGGVFFQRVRQPLTMALMAGVVGGVIATGWFAKKTKRRKSMNKTSVQEWFAATRQRVQAWLSKTKRSDPPYFSDPEQGKWLEGIFFLLGLVAFAALVLGIIAYSQPASRMVKDDFNYEHLAFYSYSASAPQGVYDANTIRSGDPIFPKLTCAVEVTLQYTLVAVGAQNLAGTYQLSATISEQVSGWQRTVPLQDPTTFNGDSFNTNATLDLCKLEKLAQSMEASTDFRPGSYLLTVSPNIHANGILAGQELNTTFDPGLTFRYDRVQFYLLGEEGNPLNASGTGVLSVERTAANVIRFLNQDFSVPALRLMAALGLVISLGGLAYLGMRMKKLSDTDPAGYIRTRFDSLIIDVQSSDLAASDSIVDVSSIDDLGKMAERFQTMILHQEQEQSHAYFVQFEGITYRYVLNAPETGAAVPEDETPQLGGVL